VTKIPIQTMPRQPASPDDLSPLERFLVAYGAALPFLPQLRPIVAAVRQAHEIDPPFDGESLDYNLKHFPPETLEPEVLEALLQVEWPEDVGFLNYLCRPQLIKAALDDLPEPDLESEDPPFDPQTAADLVKRFDSIIMPAILHATGLGAAFLQVFARTLARYIVVGPMELPQPIPNPLMQRVIIAPVRGETLVIAIVNRAGDPKKTAKEFVKAHHRLFKRTARTRVGPEFERDAWVWATYEGLKAEEAENLRRAEIMGEPHTDIGVYARIADLYFELYPNKAHGAPDSPERDRHIENLIPTLRKARQRFQERFFEAPEEPQAPPDPA